MSNKSGLWKAGFGEIGATLKSLENAGVTVEHLALIRSKEKLAREIADLCKAAEPSDIKLAWTRIYKKYFNRRVNFSALTIPTNYDVKEHFCVIVAKGISEDEVVKGLRRLFSVDLYDDDLSRDVTSDRCADHNYVILFRKNIEADQEFKNFSADYLKERFVGITLLERLLLEIWYFDATRKHLDVKNTTLCSNSRDSHDDVPCVGWNPKQCKLDVFAHRSGFSGFEYRARIVVF